MCYRCLKFLFFPVLRLHVLTLASVLGEVISQVLQMSEITALSSAQTLYAPLAFWLGEVISQLLQRSEAPSLSCAQAS